MERVWANVMGCLCLLIGHRYGAWTPAGQGWQLRCSRCQRVHDTRPVPPAPVVPVMQVARGNWPAPTTGLPVPQHQTSHAFHLLMTVFTCGLWAPVWLIVHLSNEQKQRQIPPPMLPPPLPPAPDAHNVRDWSARG